jgi:hypothetical protein
MGDALIVIGFHLFRILVIHEQLFDNTIARDLDCNSFLGMFTKTPVHESRSNFRGRTIFFPFFIQYAEFLFVIMCHSPSYTAFQRSRK